MEITKEIVKELLDYDPETGVFTWKIRDTIWFPTARSHKIWNSRFSGKRAGWVYTGSTGYQCRQIAIRGQKFYEHRIAWLWMNGDPVPVEIDHKNRDALDNRWCNLESSNRGNNMLNQSRRIDNRSGVTGVCWDARYGGWRANCRIGGKQEHVGKFENIEDAERAIIEFRSRSGFSDGHGEDLAIYHDKG